MAEEIKKELPGKEEPGKEQLEDNDTEKINGGYSGPQYTYDLAKDKKNS